MPIPWPTFTSDKHISTWIAHEFHFTSKQAFRPQVLLEANHFKQVELLFQEKEENVTILLTGAQPRSGYKSLSMSSHDLCLPIHHHCVVGRI